MKRKIQVLLSEEAWNLVESITKEASENFDVGTINYSDVINEMVIGSKLDIKALQLKHTDLRRSLRVMASKETVDIDAIIKSLNELKAKSLKRKPSANGEERSEE